MEKSPNSNAPIADPFYPKNVISSSKVLEVFPKLTLSEKEFIPKPISRSVRKRQMRSGRFKTQPITFSEIKEVDEEPLLVISNQNQKSQTNDMKSVSEIDNQTPSKFNKPIIVTDDRFDQNSSSSKSFLPP